MLHFVRHKPYWVWTIICLIVGACLGIWGFVATSANFYIEPGLTGDLLARAEHNRDETAIAAAIGGFLLPLPFWMVGLVVIWSALRWR